LKEFSGDNAELYAEEKEQQEKEAKAAERERLSKVGGLLKPSELAEDDDELWLEKELRTEFVDATAQYVKLTNTPHRWRYSGSAFDG